MRAPSDWPEERFDGGSLLIKRLRRTNLMPKHRRVPCNVHALAARWRIDHSNQPGASGALLDLPDYSRMDYAPRRP